MITKELVIQVLVGKVVKGECVRSGPCLYSDPKNPCSCAAEVAEDILDMVSDDESFLFTRGK